MSTITRNGKIARLPRAVRDELNRRLDDGESGKSLVRWLNDLPEVRAAMAEHFTGRAVSEQNLSEWKQGGFLDWQRQREAVDSLKLAVEEAKELSKAAGTTPVPEIFAASIALMLSRQIRDLGHDEDQSPKQRQDMLALIRQWTLVRRDSHKAARLRMAQHDWVVTRTRAMITERQKARADAQAEEKASLAALQAEIDEEAWAPIRLLEQAMARQAAVEQMATGQPPEVVAKICEFCEIGPPPAEDLPLSEDEEWPGEEDTDPTESDLIQPDPSGFSEDGETVRDPPEGMSGRETYGYGTQPTSVGMG